MPRKRLTHNKGFPRGWRMIHGAIYYDVPKGQEKRWDDKKLFRLGKSAPEAYKKWAERIDNPDKARTIGQLLERYALEIIPKKAPKTQKDNHSYMKRLHKAFGHMAVDSVIPMDAYGYVDSRDAKVAAKREIALLRHALTLAGRWGIINRNPLKGELELEGEPARSRYVEDWEIEECYCLKPIRRKDSIKMLQAYVRLKVCSGISRVDLLLMKIEYAKDDGVHVTRHKTGKRTIYEWTPELRAAWEEALSVRPVDIAPWLFCNRRGLPYFNEEMGTTSGFESLWHRFMARLLKETKITERFHEHDIRAKTSSDANDDEHARKLLSHSNVAVTRKYYRRKPERVRPSK
jgi:hypothetical protein